MNQNAFNAGFKTRAVINSVSSTTVRSTKGVVLGTKSCVTSFIAGWNAKPSMAQDTACPSRVVQLSRTQYKVLSHG